MMVITTATLCIDLGNSSTRVLTLLKKQGNSGKVVSRFTEIPNRYAEVASLEDVPKQYTQTEDFAEADYTTKVFEYNDRLFVVGDYTSRERADVIRPSALEKKYNSLTSELSIRMALQQGYLDLADILKTYPDNLDVTWNITVLMPPADISMGAETLSEKIRGIDKVVFHHPEMKVEPKIEDVKILAEGFSAFLGVLFTEEGKVRKEYLNLAQSVTLVTDIGAGTTDFSLVSNSTAVESMLDSISLGGNNVVQLLRKSLRNKGITTTDAEAQVAVKTGYIQDGATKRSIIPELEESKKRVASEISNAIQDYFEFSTLPARSVSYLLVVGGGSINSLDDSKPLGYYLAEYLRRLSPNIELVTLPEGTNARSLNTYGAGVASLSNM